MDPIQQIAIMILAAGLVYLILYNVLPNPTTVPVTSYGMPSSPTSSDVQLAETIGVVQQPDGSLKPIGYGQVVASGPYGIRGQTCINNRLPQEPPATERSPNDMQVKYLRKLAEKGLIPPLDGQPSPGSIPDVPKSAMTAENYLSPYPLPDPRTVNQSLNTSLPTDHSNTINPPVGEGLGPNLTTSSVYNPAATGVLPKNQELAGSGPSSGPAEFGNNITDVGGFYRHNPDVFDRTVAKITNPADWESQSKGLETMAQNRQPNGTIYAYNFPELYGQFARCQ
jgi:hypothetical protein